MKLIITKSIEKLDLSELERVFPLDAIKAAAKKALEGLGVDIKSSAKIPNTLLSKVYLTSTGGAGRAVFLLQVSSDKSILVMLRLKNDKKVGANMTIQNQKFKAVLEKNLDLILTDLGKGSFTEYTL